MKLDGRVALAKKSSGSHDGTACSHARDECVRPNRVIAKLPPNLRTGSLFVSFNICVICELRWQKHIWVMQRQIFRHTNAAKKAALILADAYDGCTEAFDED